MSFGSHHTMKPKRHFISTTILREIGGGEGRIKLRKRNTVGMKRVWHDQEVNK